MTPEQVKCLTFISEFIAQNGFSPSYAEIGAHLGLASKSGVCRLIGALERAGKVRRVAYAARSVEVNSGTIPQPAILANRLATLLADAYEVSTLQGRQVIATQGDIENTILAALTK